MKKSAKGLVEYAKAQLGLPYWFGTYGNTATQSLHTSKKKQYPNYYDQSRYKVRFDGQYGKRVHDCAGLIKGYIWSDTPTSAPKYSSAQDIGADTMLAKATVKGTIDTIPEVAGLTVHFKGHIGVYIGNGEVIEAQGHDYGVTQTKLKNRPWTHWCQNPLIDYDGTYVPKTTNKQMNDIYKIINDVNIRATPNGKKLTYKEFTLNCRRQIQAIRHEEVDCAVKGMTVTVKEIQGNWGRIPSGWVYIPGFLKKL